MIDRVLIDSLNLKARDFAVRWKDMIRGAPHLKHYQTMDDEALIEINKAFYPANLLWCYPQRKKAFRFYP